MIGNEFERLRFNALMNKKVESPSTGGYLYGWGINYNGQLGLGHKNNVEKPTLIIEYENFIQRNHLDNTGTILFIIDGKLYTAGYNGGGTTGLNLISGETENLTQLTDWDDWEMVSYGSDLAAGIRGGKLYAWGTNSRGNNKRIPTQVGTKDDWVYVSAAWDAIVLKDASNDFYYYGYSNEFIVPNFDASTSIDFLNKLSISEINFLNECEFIGFGGDAMKSFYINNGELYGSGKNYKSSLDITQSSSSGLRLRNISNNYNDWTYANPGSGASRSTLIIRNGEVIMIGGILGARYHKLDELGGSWVKITGENSVFIRHQEFNLIGLKEDGTLWNMKNNNYTPSNRTFDINQIGTDNDWIDILSNSRTFLVTKASKIKE